MHAAHEAHARTAHVFATGGLTRLELKLGIGGTP